MTKLSPSDKKAKYISAIDSFKIRIPLELVQVKDPNLTASWRLVNEGTGEIDPDYFKSNSLAIKENGKSTRYAIEDQSINKEGTKRPFLTLLINSKLLESNYFDGIHNGNIMAIYGALMAQNVVSFKFADMLNFGLVTDIDFKKDARSKDFDHIVNELRNISKPSKQKDKGYRSWNYKDNKGIEWSTRKSTSYKSNPFLKLYHKQLELDNNSKEFTSAYLNGIDYSDKVRLETTVKNASHFRLLGIEDNSLNTILNLSNEQKEHIFNSALAKHLEPRIKQLKDSDKLKPMESIIYGLLMIGLKSGNSFESCKTLTLNLIDNKTERNRKRKLLDEIYTNHIEGSKEDKESKIKDQFWTFLGW